KILDIGKRGTFVPFPDQAVSINNLAVVLYKQNDFAGARDLFIEATARFVQIYGPKHEMTLVSSTQLAKTFSKMGCQEKAANIFNAVKEIRERNGGMNDLGSLNFNEDLSEFLFEQKRYVDFISTSEKVVEASLNMLGPEHPDTVWRMTKLSSVY